MTQEHIKENGDCQHRETKGEGKGGNEELKINGIGSELNSPLAGFRGISGKWTGQTHTRIQTYANTHSE